MGDYELLEEIARGGMGVVFRARQISLNRLVAVKVLLTPQSKKDAQRFRREAELAASLNHPDIVSIYDIGEQDGQPFFAMELIEGQSLSELCRNQPLGARRSAGLTKRIAEAVHFAHERNLLHRDLKPSNVLIDAAGGPHITDFGLAKRTDGDADLTLTGQVLGTPNYMPPEHAGGSGRGTTRASDVYSLGAILYQLLTGHAPFVAESVTQTLRLVVETEVVPPRLLNPELPRDLETLCLRCLEKDPARRYASAQMLAAELGRFLNNEPIEARPVGVAGRVARWCQRKPALAAALGLCAAFALLLAIGSPIVLVRVNAARRAAEAAEVRTEQQLSTALLEQARATLRSGEPGQRVRVLEAVQRAAAISNRVELRREALDALTRTDLRLVGEVPFETGVTMAVLDPTFARVAECVGSGPVRLRSMPDRQLIASLTPSVKAVAEGGQWSPQGRFLAVKRRIDTVKSSFQIEIWDVATSQLIASLPPSLLGTFCFHPRSAQLLAAEADDRVSLWDLEQAQRIKTFSITGQVHHLRFAPNGATFLAQHRIGSPWFTSLYSITNGAVLKTSLSGWVDDIAWDLRDRWIALAARSGEIFLHDRATAETTVLGRHKNEARSAVFTPDGELLFTGGQEQEIICWDMRLRQRVLTSALHSTRMQLDATGQRCAVMTRTGALLHSLERSSSCRELAGDLGSSLRHAAFSPDGRWLAVGGTRAGLWDLTRNEPVVVAFHAEDVTPIFSPDSSELLGFGGKGLGRQKIQVDHKSNGTPFTLSPLPAPEIGRIHSGQIVSNSLLLGTPAGLLSLSTTNLSSGRMQRFRTGDYVRGQVSSDGRWLAARMTKVILAYRLDPWTQLTNINFHTELVAHAFTPENEELAVADVNGVTFLDTANWTAKRHLAVPLERNTQLFFTPDGRGFWLGSDAGEAGFYDRRTLALLLPLPRGTTPMALSADGRLLAVNVDARRVQVWDLRETGKQLQSLGLDWEADQISAQGPTR